MVLLCELRGALSTCVFELESLKLQFEGLCPGKVGFKEVAVAEDVYTN